MSRDRAKELCTRKLARLLYEDRCNRGIPGDDIGDWVRAERYLEEHQEIVDPIAYSLWPDSFSDQDFELTYGKRIHDEAFLPMMQQEAA